MKEQKRKRKEIEEEEEELILPGHLGLKAMTEGAYREEAIKAQKAQKKKKKKLLDLFKEEGPEGGF